VHIADLDSIRARETFVGRSCELAEVCAAIDAALPVTVPCSRSPGRGNKKEPKRPPTREPRARV
jgi:hypothetical protein